MVRLTAAGAALIAVTYGLARFTLGLFMPEFRVAFDLTATGAGLVMAASFGGYLVALAAAGPAVARRGARTVAVASGVAATAGLLGVAAAPGPATLAAAAAVGGTSTGLASPSLTATVQRQLAARARPRAQTMINAGTSLGLIAAPPVALVAATTWRAAWVAFAVLALVATVGAAWAVRPDDGGAALPAAGRLSRPLQVSAVLLGVSSAAFWGFGRELFETTSALGPVASRGAWAAVGVGGLAGGAAGALADARGLRVALLASWAVFGLAHAWLALGPAAVVPAVALAGAFGAGYMALSGLLIVWSVAERPDRPGSAVATAFLLLAAGQVAGSPLVGVIADTLGLPAAFAVAAVLAAAGTLPALTPAAQHLARVGSSVWRR